jgi:hypothetical protein
MIEALGLTLAEATVLGLLGIVSLVLGLFPFLWPALVMFRKSPAVPHRLAFSGLVGVLVYGVFAAIFTCVGIPIEALLTYIVPQLEYSGYFEGVWVLRAISFLYKYGWLLIPVVLIALTIGITQRMSSRWERLVIAWSG